MAEMPQAGGWVSNGAEAVVVPATFGLVVSDRKGAPRVYVGWGSEIRFHAAMTKAEWMPCPNVQNAAGIQ